MSTFYRKTIPVLITFFAGMLMAVEWFVPISGIGAWTDVVKSIAVIVVGFMFIPGLINLVYSHLSRTRESLKSRKDNQWFYSCVLLFVVALFIVPGVVLGPTSATYTWIFNWILTPSAATGYAAILFPMLAGCYSSVRARGREAAVLVASVVIVLLANAPLWAAAIPYLADLSALLFRLFVDPVFRAITIGVGIGSLVVSLRTLLGLETRHLGWEREK